MDYSKDGLWVNYFLTEAKNNPYASGLLRQLKNWLNEDGEVSEMAKKVPFVSREELCRK